MMKKMKGFTLAEVLTTLMVIGVVAALTIPTLISSTNESQHQAAYKKAVANLENGIGLLKANQTPCVVNGTGASDQLAACFKNVIQGTLVNSEGSSSGMKNVILTPDGVAYEFIETSGGDHPNARSIDSICPAMMEKWERDTYGNRHLHDGSRSHCAVLIDLDGFSKGKTSIDEDGDNSWVSTDIGEWASYVANSDETDQQLVLIDENGVYPYFDTDNSDSKANKGYKWMHGEDASALYY